MEIIAPLANFFKTKPVKVFTLIFAVNLYVLTMAGCSGKSLAKSNYNKSRIYNVKQAVVPEYQLGFGDVLEIKFFNNNQFNETVSVRPDGRITMEKIGDIFVDGMTPSQLDSLITKTYADIILDPDVTVFVRQFGGYKVYVLGEVNTPGGMVLERNMTVLQALAAAGGFKTTAQLGNVMVMRPGKNNTISAIKIDIDSYLDSDGLNQRMDNLFLQPQDVIYVTTTFFADVNTFLTQVYAGVLPPLDVYLRALWWSER